jgi:hypothetical protein
MVRALDHALFFLVYINFPINTVIIVTVAVVRFIVFVSGVMLFLFSWL